MFTYQKKILAVDAQNSFNEGVLILVTGYLTGKDSLRHKFTQSFFLAPQDKGYFVLNDAFRYVDGGSQSFVNDVGVPLTPDPGVVDGEVYNRPENVQASIEEEEMPVGEVVDEVSDEWQIVPESNSETEETPKKSYASIVKVMKESPAAFSTPTYAPRRMAGTRLIQWLNLLVWTLVMLKTEGANVSITIVEDAVAKGAVCLDGSPPAYHWDKGFGAGINNWLVNIEGGGWCNNVTLCLNRSETRLGSSKHMDKAVAFTGILSRVQNYNPDFYNWNRIRIRYCDGASFTGDVEAVDPATNLHFRGARIWPAVIEDLLSKGMKDAKNAFLSGSSAGGLASILHCDSFRALIPGGAKVKCLSDAGYFINVKDISGAQHIEEFYSQVVATHGSAKNLPSSCTSKIKPELCFFPQNVAHEIKTPIIFVNAAYDSWQIKNILVPTIVDPHGTWHYCRRNIKNCSDDQIQTMQGFRLDFLKALENAGNSSSKGLFIDSCYDHGQTELQETWLFDVSPLLAKTTIAKAVGDWYYDRRPFQKIDCPYPCNPTCHNLVTVLQEHPEL